MLCLAFLGRGVLRMERDSVMHSTISSAASAWLSVCVCCTCLCLCGSFSSQQCDWQQPLIGLSPSGPELPLGVFKVYCHRGEEETYRQPTEAVGCTLCVCVRVVCVCVRRKVEKDINMHCNKKEDLCKWARVSEWSVYSVLQLLCFSQVMGCLGVKTVQWFLQLGVWIICCKSELVEPNFCQPLHLKIGVQAGTCPFPKWPEKFNNVQKNATNYNGAVTNNIFSL